MKKLFVSVIATGLVTSCISNQSVEQQRQEPTNEAVVINRPVQVTKPVPMPAPVVNRAQKNYTTFYEWKRDFTDVLLHDGYLANDVQRFMNMAQLNPSIIAQDKKQAEFSKMPWEYVDSALASSRIATGRTKLNNNPTLFGNIQNRYGVDPAIVTAIWGMESSYGGFTGSSNLVGSLSTLAFEGRRREFAENQLKSLLDLLNRGDVSWYQLDGSWAGGMGHTQFIPGTWVQQGVDYDGDGKRNPWNSFDALSSTANYLNNSGWINGLRPVYEVNLPQNFDFRKTGTTNNYDSWSRQGIRSVSGGFIPNTAALKLWLPAGKNGPALLTSQNFDVIKVYNNSSNYALGVSLLADKIAGRSSINTAWPRYEKPLTTAQVLNLQRNLTNAGYDTKGIDGIIGTNTNKAFAQWQYANGHTPDGFITQNSASSLVW